MVLKCLISSRNFRLFRNCISKINYLSHSLTCGFVNSVQTKARNLLVMKRLSDCFLKYLVLYRNGVPRPLKIPQIVWLFRRYYMWTRLYGGETPLSVFNVGFAHDGGIPPTPPPNWGRTPKPPKLYGCLGGYIMCVL